MATGRTIEGEAQEVRDNAAEGGQSSSDETRQARKPGGHGREGEGMALAIYILYLISIFTAGLAAIVGVVLAHLFGGGVRNPALASHYRFQVHTFWKGLVYIVIASLLSLVSFGLLAPLFVLLAVWVGVRCGLGIRDLMRDQAVPRPTTWGFY
ncbi:MAG: DUF4870 family protein [Thioalkalivibrionaceae bacterium]